MKKIQISAGEISAIAILNDGPTADAIWHALPIEGRANTWGQKVPIKSLDVVLDFHDRAHTKGQKVPIESVDGPRLGTRTFP